MISGANLSYHFNPDWFTVAPRLLQLVRYPLWAISLLVYPLMWFGLAMSAWAAFHLVAKRREPTPLDHIAALLLGVVVTQMILDGVGHVYAHPHYYNGTWIVFPLLAWIGLQCLIRLLAWLRFIVPVQAVALATISFVVAIGIHLNRGVQNVAYGPCLGDEIRLVRELNARGVHGPFRIAAPDGQTYADDPFNFGPEVDLSTISSDVPNFVKFPHGLNLIQELIDPGRANSPDGRWLGIRSFVDDPKRIDLRVVELKVSRR